ncbi:MAG: membrane dipeptidase [Candidatus Latescibacterota bacterium]|nr:membrane dipeptidase [Candidatus Latescibacterota bacterium]
MNARAAEFHAHHPVCDMLGLNLTHPRFCVADVDLGRRDDSSCRGDFPKFGDWGLNLVVCKGGSAHYDDNYKALWPSQLEYRSGREPLEEMFLSLAIKNTTQLCLAVLDRFLVNVEENLDKVVLVRRRGDIEKAVSQRKIAVLMAANRSDWFGDSPGVLRMFARTGLRMITIGQSTRELGWDASGETRSGGRMTELGVRMIAELNLNGILIDLAHSNDPCALDVIEISERPVVDSHSNPRALEPGPRSIPDEIMRALSQSGGVLGITPPISRPPGETLYKGVDAKEIKTTLQYLDYAIEMMGIDHVGIGTHFNSAALPWMTEILLDAGYPEADAARILGGNFLRVLDQVLPD